MPYFKLDKMRPYDKQRLLGEFYSLLAPITDKEESRLIFRDLLTFDGIANLMRRIDVAILLMVGCDYSDIRELLDVGTGKIRSVSRKLRSDKYGGGYQKLVERLVYARKKRRIKIRKIERKQARKGEKPDIEALKNKPGHFGPWDLIDELGDYLVIRSEEKEIEQNLKEQIKDDYKRFKQR